MHALIGIALKLTLCQKKGGGKALVSVGTNWNDMLIGYCYFGWFCFFLWSITLKKKFLCKTPPQKNNTILRAFWGKMSGLSIAVQLVEKMCFKSSIMYRDNHMRKHLCLVLVKDECFRWDLIFLFLFLWNNEFRILNLYYLLQKCYQNYLQVFVTFQHDMMEPSLKEKL